MSADEKPKGKDVSYGAANPMTPEVFADHVLGIGVHHGVGRILMIKHRPVPAFVGDNVGIMDTPAEACVLIMPESGLRELRDELNTLFDETGAENDSD